MREMKDQFNLSLRESLLFFVAGFILALSGCDASPESTSPVSLSQEPGANDWPSFLGSHQNGISEEVGIRTDWTGGKLPVLWTRELGEGYAPGVAVGERYYHFDRCDEGARVVCLDAGTGEQSWEFIYPSEYKDLYGYDRGPRSCPVVDGDTVFVYGVEGVIHALDAGSGQVRWEQNINERFGVHQNFFGVSSPPVVFEDKLLLMVGGSPADNKIRPGALDEALPNGNAIVAFDKSNGEIIYEVGDDLASYTSIRIVQHEGRDWAFAWARTSLIAFDPRTGEIDFEFPWRARTLESVNASTPVVFDGHVFLSECYSLGSVLLKFGSEVDDKHQVVWKDEGRDKSLMTHWNTAIYDQGFLYGSSGRHSNGATLRCINAMTGEVQWSREGFGRCNMTWVDGSLAVVSENGQLMLIKADPEKFEMVTAYGSGSDEKIRFQYPSWAAPVIANGKMYVRGKSNLVCFDLIDD